MFFVKLLHNIKKERKYLEYEKYILDAIKYNLGDEMFKNILQKINRPY